MSAQLDLVEYATTAVERIQGQVADAEIKRKEFDEEVSNLILNEASQKEIAAAKKRYWEADEHLGALKKASEEADRRLATARTDQELEGLKGNLKKIASLSKKRASALDEADTLFIKFLEKLDEADDAARDIHIAGNGVPALGAAINQRYRRLGGYIAIKLLEYFGHSEFKEGFAGGISNRSQGVTQYMGKTLKDLDANYEEMYREKHKQRLKGDEKDDA